MDLSIIALPVLFGIGEMLSDFNFMLKVFVLMAIVSFVKNHIGTGPVSWIVILGFAAFIFGNLWKFFGGIYVIYMLLVFGISGVLIDFFFMRGTGASGAEQGGIEQPISSGADVAKRAAANQARRPMRPGR